MKLDREYQRNLLEMMSGAYPRSFDHRVFCKNFDQEEEDKFIANLVYLDEHGLIESSVQFGLDGHVSMGLPKITARGMDFLADDGGLSAILGVVTVKFNEDQLRAILEKKIDASSLSLTEKSWLHSTVEKLSTESLKHLTLKLLDKGLEHMPNLHTLLNLVNPN